MRFKLSAMKPIGRHPFARSSRLRASGADTICSTR